MKCVKLKVYDTNSKNGMLLLCHEPVMVNIGDELIVREAQARNYLGVYGRYLKEVERLEVEKLGHSTYKVVRMDKVKQKKLLDAAFPPTAKEKAKAKAKAKSESPVKERSANKSMADKPKRKRKDGMSDSN